MGVCLSEGEGFRLFPIGLVGNKNCSLSLISSRRVSGRLSWEQELLNIPCPFFEVTFSIAFDRISWKLSFDIAS